MMKLMVTSQKCFTQENITLLPINTKPQWQNLDPQLVQCYIITLEVSRGYEWCNIIIYPWTQKEALLLMARWPDSLSTRPDKLNTLNCQCNYVRRPQGPPIFIALLYGILIRYGTTLWYFYVYAIGTCTVIKITTSTVTAPIYLSEARHLSITRGVVSMVSDIFALLPVAVPN